MSGIASFPADALQKLAAYWITTAEELVSAATRENGLADLAQILVLPAEQAGRLVELAQNALPPGVSFAPDEVRRHGLGAQDTLEGGDTGGSADVSFAPLPPKVDLHGQMPPIRDQGQRGTCVAFATTAVREFWLGASAPTPDLSEQFLYWDCKKHDLLPGPGTLISVGMQCLLDEGECPEQAWPYNPTPIAGNESQDPPPAGAASQAVSYRISGTQKLPPRSVDSFRQTLAGGSPVAFALPVYTFWFAEPAQTSGDLRLPLANDHLEGGHAICMVGYEDDPQVPGGGYFIFRNSWGTGWARQSSVAPGYARIPYDYIKQYCSAAQIATVTSQPLPKPAPETGGGGFLDILFRFLRAIFGSKG